MPPINRLASRRHADNADHGPQRNAQLLVPHQLVSVDLAEMRAPGVEAIAAHPLALAGAGSRLPVELDGLDGDFQRPAGHRALHKNRTRGGIDVIPIDLIELVLGPLHLIAEAILRTHAHRRPRRHH